MRAKGQSSLLRRLREVGVLRPQLQREKRGRGHLQAIAAAFLAARLMAGCDLEVNFHHGLESKRDNERDTAPCEPELVGESVAPPGCQVPKQVPGMRPNL